MQNPNDWHNPDVKKKLSDKNVSSGDSNQSVIISLKVILYDSEEFGNVHTPLKNVNLAKKMWVAMHTICHFKPLILGKFLRGKDKIALDEGSKFALLVGQFSAQVISSYYQHALNLSKVCVPLWCLLVPV